MRSASLCPVDFQVVRLAIVLVAAQNAGGDSFHPMGRVRGSLINGSSPCLAGNSTPAWVHCMLQANAQPAESVQHVNLGQVHRSKAWICVVCQAQHTLESPTKLHCVLRCWGNGVVIDTKVRAARHCSGPSVPLRHHTQWAQPQVTMM